MKNSRLRKFLIQWDHFVDRPLHRITKTWTYLTGRDNFALARLCLFVGVSLVVAGSVGEFVMDPDNSWSVIGLILAPAWMWFGHRRLRFYRSLQEQVDKIRDGAISLNLDPFELSTFIWDRLTYNALGVLLLPAALMGRPVSAGLVIYFMSLHFVMHFDCRGGKSVFARAKDKAKALVVGAADKVRDLVPQPQPIPVPIGA